jgi:hypothetical protein
MLQTCTSFIFSSLPIVTCFFLFLYLLNMQENMSCQTNVQHVFALLTNAL